MDTDKQNEIPAVEVANTKGHFITGEMTEGRKKEVRWM